MMGRFRFFQSIAKERKERVNLIAAELKALWSMKLNFPYVSDQAIRAKFEKLLLEYDYCSKKHDFESLNELFDVTKVKGEWLCKENKNLYKRQVHSKGQVGYSTGKRASAQTSHPSKRRKTVKAILTNLETPSSSVASDFFESSINSCDTSEDSSWEDKAAPSTSTRKHNLSGVARRLVTSSKLPTYRTARPCRQLSGEGIEIPNASQQGIHKALFKTAGEVKQHLVNTIHCEKWSYTLMVNEYKALNIKLWS